MTHDEIKLALFDYGHFRNPVNRGENDAWNLTREEVAGLPFTHPYIKTALASYQSFMVNVLDPLAFAVHERAAVPDGDIGPATEALFEISRCNCPDFAAAATEHHTGEATGRGSWPANCYPDDWPDTHAIKIAFDTSGMRSWLSDVFDTQVWPTVQKAFVDIGLMLIREDDNDRAHLQASFVRPSGGWIGLAIVPGSTSCTLSIWQKYDRDYQPRDLVREWSTLIMHETGHNLGLDHTRGGVMNPSIINGLPAQWRDVNDPSESTLVRWFGGEPVDVPGPGPKSWTHQGFKDENNNEEFWTQLRPPIPR